MKKIVLVTLALGGGIAAFFSPPTALFLALVFVVALAVPNSAVVMSPIAGGYGYAPLMSVWSLLKNAVATMMLSVAVPASIWHLARRRGEELVKWLTAMFLTALADLALMAWTVLKSLAPGYSGNRRISSILPA